MNLNDAVLQLRHMIGYHDVIRFLLLFVGLSFFIPLFSRRSNSLKTK